MQSLEAVAEFEVKLLFHRAHGICENLCSMALASVFA